MFKRLKSVSIALFAAVALAACGPSPSYNQSYAQPPMYDASGVPLQQMAQPQERGFLSEHGDALLGAGAGYLLGKSAANNRSTTTIIQPGYTTTAPAQRYYSRPYTGYSNGSRPMTSSSSRSINSRGVTSSTSRSSGSTSRSYSSSRR